MLRRGEVPEAPPGHGERFGKSIHGERSFPHSGQRREGEVRRGRVDDVLVNLIREHQEPRMGPDDVRDGRQRSFAVHGAGRV